MSNVPGGTVEGYAPRSVVFGFCNPSLRSLEEKFAKEETQQNFSISDLYSSLYVLENQKFAPVQVLSGMWGISEASANRVCLDFSSLSLAKLSSRSLRKGDQIHEYNGITIHDLHLDYCRLVEEMERMESGWYERLLNRPKEQYGDKIFDNSRSRRKLGMELILENIWATEMAIA